MNERRAAFLEMTPEVKAKLMATSDRVIDCMKDLAPMEKLACMAYVIRYLRDRRRRRAIESVDGITVHGIVEIGGNKFKIFR